MDDNNLEFSTLPSLWREYATTRRSHTFAARDSQTAEKWQEQLRRIIRELLGGFPEERCGLELRLLESHQGADYTRELVAIQTLPGQYMPCFVLIPHGGVVKHKPIIALHGHGTWGGEAIVKAPEDPLGAALNQQLNYDYAGQFAKRGFLVFVPELRGFGRRLEDPEYQEANDPQWISSCYAIGVNALLLGKTILGLRVYDIMRLIDYIQTRKDIASGSLGCVGLSGGGMVTLFTTALDQRITCAVVSGYFNSFRTSIMAIRHCLCNFVPGILQVAEMVDIAGLVAPRPMLIESGTRDPIFPVEATRKAYTALQEIYKVFEAKDHVDIDIFEGEHAWSGAKAYGWMEKWL